MIEYEKLKNKISNWFGELKKTIGIESINTIKEMIERAKPKKVRHIDEDFHMFVCPNKECRSTIQCTDDYDHKYCLECGQALKWSD